MKHAQEWYAIDSQAGPVHSYRRLDQDPIDLLTGQDQPQIIEVVVWPYPEAHDQRPELRRYYALNLPQAVARATEIEVRLREQELKAMLIGLRPATADETNTFFRAMDALDSGMPAPVTADTLKDRHLGPRTLL